MIEFMNWIFLAFNDYILILIVYKWLYNCNILPLIFSILWLIIFLVT